MSKETVKKVIIYSVVFLLGFGFAPRAKEVIVTKEVPTDRVVEVVKEVPAQCDYTNWKLLKETDDKGFSLFSEFADIASNAFYAVADGDVDKLGSLVKDMEVVGGKIKALVPVRQSVLSKLGY
jgi:hypothetical protein